MAEETIHLSHSEFQNLATGTDAAATIDFIEQLKEGRKYLVTDNEKTFVVVLDNEESPTLKPLEFSTRPPRI
jgi:uncharacterized protein YifE (UPF0438 family)